jgi:hypothetical protein
MTHSTTSQTHLFGIRHHGPGSARSLLRALTELKPDIVLVEGPPDAESVLPLLSHKQMKPPVALLLYAQEEPHRCVYYPFAIYSPEWQAIRYALNRRIPVRFMDLPQTHQLALAKAEEEKAIAEAQSAMEEAKEEEPEETRSETDVVAEEAPDDAPVLDLGAVRGDPLRWIAQAAGYSDGESWWEHMVEQRQESADLFQGILEMMTALREVDQDSRSTKAIRSENAPDLSAPDRLEARREAWMRQTIRAAEKEGFQRIAVVCGAWHTPALANRPPAKEDAELLAGMPKVKVAATWVPWTYGRLTFWSGYGAGIESPAWYEHLWQVPDRVAVNWMTRAAKLFRKEDLPASPASVIEGVRLAETLAALRGRPLPGLPELWEAAQAIFCFGSETPMQLIQERLIVGDRLGKVPDETPMLPIQLDLRREQKRLRLEPEAAHSDKDFDLRKPTDLERSYLLHRLNLMGIPWGQLQRTGGGKGTFHELWRIQWHPEFEVALIEANVWGNTVEKAVSAKVRDTAVKSQNLSELTTMVEDALNANLPDAISTLMVCLQNLAALTSDLPHLMSALPPMANVLRYGNVRQTDTGMVGHVVEGLVARICVGLPTACASLNDEAAEAMYALLGRVNESILLLQNEEYDQMWHSALRKLADMEGIHGLIAGVCCRLLLDQKIWLPEEMAQRMGLALSVANEPTQSAAWIEGMLKGSGALLLHNDALWHILDEWVSALPDDIFLQLLPLLRRTFATFPAAERRQMGERARSGGAAGRSILAGESDIQPQRAERVLPILAKLLGLHEPQTTGAE